MVMRFAVRDFNLHKGYLMYRGYVVTETSNKETIRYIIKTLVENFTVERFMELDAQSTPLMTILEAKGGTPKPKPIPTAKEIKEQAKQDVRDERAKEFREALKEVEEVGEKASNHSLLQIHYGKGYGWLTSVQKEQNITYRNCDVCNKRFTTNRMYCCNNPSCRKKYKPKKHNHSTELAYRERKREFNKDFKKKYGAISNDFIADENNGSACNDLKRHLGLSSSELMCEFGDIE